MQYTKLGNSELNVSRICMGCMGFGDAKNGQHSWTVDEEHSREIIKKGFHLASIFLIRPLATRAAQASSILEGRCGTMPKGRKS